MRKIALITVIALSFLATCVIAEPTYQYSKVLLNPYYRVELVKNTDYPYSFTLNPPDGYDHTLSAIVSFNTLVSPPTDFTLQVDGEYCNPNPFSVSGSYAVKGGVQISFDCTNTISGPGTYTMTLRSDDDTGFVYGWVDFVYQNEWTVGGLATGGVIDEVGKVKGRVMSSDEMTVMGTEYWQGERGTVFLQLRDTDGLPVTDGECHLDIYYPNLNGTHSNWVTDGLMLYQPTSNGLYYYDFNVPNTVGVYMVEASCVYTVDQVHYYEGSSSESPNRTAVSGVYTGPTFTLDEFDDGLSSKCYSTAKICDAYYDFVLDNTTVDSLDVAFLGETTASATLYMYVWNWTNTSWDLLPNTLLFSGTALSSGPSGLDEYLSNAIDVGYIHTNKSVKVRLYSTSGNTLTQYNNWLNLIASQDGVFVQDVKGAGELNVHSASQFGSGGTGSPYYDIYTLCGDDDSYCGVLVNDTDYYLPEGAIEDNITVEAYANINTTWLYQMPDSTTCGNFYWIKTNYTGSWVEVPYDDILKSSKKTGCELNIPINLTAGEHYHYIIRYDNAPKYKVLQMRNMIHHMNYSIADFCRGYGASQNYTYEVPVNISIDLDALMEQDDYLHGCLLYEDAMYWADYMYQDSLDSETIGEYESFYLEYSDFLSKQIIDNYRRWQTEQLRADISSVNNTVKEEHIATRDLIDTWGTSLNNTITYYGTMIINDISSAVSSINSNINSWGNTIVSEIATVNSSVITYGQQINSTTYDIWYYEPLDLTIWEKLIGIQAEIASVNQTVILYGNVTGGPSCYEQALCTAEYMMALDVYRNS